MNEIASALQSMKIIYDIAMANKGLLNYNELVSAVAEVHGKLVEANAVALASQEKQSVLSERVRELEKKIMEYEDRESGLQKYESYTFPTGTRALALKPEMQGGEPLHYLCESCADKGQISRMQPDGFHNGNGCFLRCHKCNLLIPVRQLSHMLERSIRGKMKS